LVPASFEEHAPATAASPKSGNNKTEACKAFMALVSILEEWLPRRILAVCCGAQMTTLVGIIMGSESDWETMSHAATMLETLGVPHEVRVVSAHRTPDLLFEYAASAASRGLRAIIAGAGGAAHLPGMCAAKTLLPVLGVPVQSKALNGLDSLLSIVQMPAGVPVATFAIGRAGAVNAALFAAQLLAPDHEAVQTALRKHRDDQTANVLRRPDPRQGTS
jgi:5-(carboxyamino)imidazole ribonucleotide mutase